MTVTIECWERGGLMGLSRSLWLELQGTVERNGAVLPIGDGNGVDGYGRLCMRLDGYIKLLTISDSTAVV